MSHPESWTVALRDYFVVERSDRHFQIENDRSDRLH